MAATTIQIRVRNRRRLARLKKPRETYDQVLEKLLALVPEGDEEGRYSDEFRIGLLEARMDSQHGRVVDHATVKKMLGL